MAHMKTLHIELKHDVAVRLTALQLELEKIRQDAGDMRRYTRSELIELLLDEFDG